MSTSFDILKDFNGKKYKGMNVGQSHHWNYTNAEWMETKITPDKWQIKLTSIKDRKISAPQNSGVAIGTEYSWYIIANQTVKKLDENKYETIMEGTKTKLGYKKPFWKKPSYEYEGQKSYVQMQLDALNEEIKTLKSLEESENGRKTI